ncbi:glycosyltransferase family 2 protein [Shimia sp. Alg240-R146]|uniref:glycosyltransferase family 2 protein n=1 Tax=Shimia sp. Alg240-R146 TaxID=2993449 RepID=UPI0022E96DEA|nr:cellulose synthase catalytic subunit [Shimia sp. Alg240-R146]
MSVAIGLWYLVWRWGTSLNPDAWWFSVIVASAETLFFLGTLLFFYDIWREQDTPQRLPPSTRNEAQLDGEHGPIGVDVFITTYDEECALVAPSIVAANNLIVPDNIAVRVYLLDDGNRTGMAKIAKEFGVTYLSRDTNLGFKAGNLRNALFQSRGDFVVICDADTRLFPTFLQNTLGYFRDPKAAWVQTPHWFYDIPEGERWEHWGARHGGRFLAKCSYFFRFVSGKLRAGADPFLSDPRVFFDVIQRRRNRHGASFCCGAGSIHRREAVFEQAMKRKARDTRALAQNFGDSSPSAAMPCVPLEPYRFHVSEDIYTSILMHADRESNWISVYHPNVEARMLSPWSMKAWASQKLKYAGGTFDIMLRDNPIFQRGMRWQIKLHYAATFGSYLSVLWAPVLLLAPAFALVTGLSPIAAFTPAFFAHFLPAILVSELAILAACKGHDIGAGRALGMASLPINLRALSLVLRGKKPQFPPTSKKPGESEGWRYIRAHLVLLGVLAFAGVFGCVQGLWGEAGYGTSMLWVNLFWLAWNMSLLGRLALAALWRPDIAIAAAQISKGSETSDDFDTAPV